MAESYRQLFKQTESLIPGSFPVDEDQPDALRITFHGLNDSTHQAVLSFGPSKQRLHFNLKDLDVLLSFLERLTNHMKYIKGYGPSHPDLGN